MSESISIWVKTILASLPVAVYIIAASTVFYGDVREINATLEGVKRMLYQHNNKDAHGTVREELGKINQAILSIQPRLINLEREANYGGRYTKEDNVEDRKLILGFIDDVRMRITRIENLTNKFEILIDRLETAAKSQDVKP